MTPGAVNVTENKLRLIRRAGFNFVSIRNQAASRFSGWSIRGAVQVQPGQFIAGKYPVTSFFEQDNSHGKIDRIFLVLPSRSKGQGRPADGLRPEAVHVTARFSRDGQR